MQVNMDREVKKRRLEENKQDGEIAIDNQLLEKSDDGTPDTAENHGDTADRNAKNRSDSHTSDASLRAAAVAAAAQYGSGYGERAGTDGPGASSGAATGGAATGNNSYSSAQDEQLLQQLRDSKNGKDDDDGIDHPETRSEDWHRMRRDNHKEVERRRRENINKGIDDLAKIVPNCDKHKGQILKKAVEFINQLQADSKKNREEYAYGEMLLKQTLSEFTTRNKALQTELEQAWREAEHWKKRTATLEKGT